MRPIVGIFKSLPAHECRNREQGRPVSFLGRYVLNFRYSADNGELYDFKQLAHLTILIHYLAAPEYGGHTHTLNGLPH
jgi:hypothetical protein